jgi:septum formation protein
MPRPFDMPLVREQDSRELRRAIGYRTVILASSSPRRREILRSCGVRFRVIRPGVDEPAPSVTDSRAWTRRWAKRKALSASCSLHTGLIVAADTIVVLKGRAMGKPADAADARRMLNHLSGRTHRVITGVAVVDAASRRMATGSVVSNVTFRAISRSEITNYLRTGEAWDKAGAYAVQGHGRRLVASVRGPIDNVVGLPVRRLAQLIARVVNR